MKKHLYCDPLLALDILNDVQDVRLTLIQNGFYCFYNILSLWIAAAVVLTVHVMCLICLKKIWFWTMYLICLRKYGFECREHIQCT